MGFRYNPVAQPALPATPYPFSECNWSSVSQHQPWPAYSLPGPVSSSVVIASTTGPSAVALPPGFTTIKQIDAYQHQQPQFSRYNQNPAKVDTTKDILNQRTKEYPNQNITGPNSYLQLPKDLFPNPRMISIDPNPLIDKMCSEDNISKHTQWILDIELGVSRVPVKKPTAVYDAEFNNIYCRNAPGIVYPEFQSCSPAFKKSLLCYYDCISSAWYMGYSTLYGANSVKHFQLWLQTPMEHFGMCWP